ncbi:LysR family transcriptional regulator [Bradyrhizobium canariense]|uniref:DNA-binding transcriptional regulator, LysR family n=1 Tax=Bradyrhizobium canariense TaxID=255045 RepID=A0A1H2BJ49_9BRAD|nr:LysR family transcriptional regulator [Bradyrhizobium canariense]SDT58107.1 DNA-binding transcriptional regulator, LysR family [Bradyrhizobium canariense]
MFNPLKYFVEVARSGSIRGASERLHVAASAISRHIQISEEDAGTPLFERHARGMGLTAAGEIYLRYAQSVLAEGDNTQLEIDALKGIKRGHIRICSIEGIIAGPLFDVLLGFRRKFPEITYSVRSMGTHTVMQAVRDGEADIGIAFQSLPVAGVRIALRIPDPLNLICTRRHPLAKSRVLTLREIAKYPLALPERTFGIRQVMDAACHVDQLRVNIALETNSIEAMRAFARAGSGVTILPSLAAKSDIEAKRVVAIPVSDPMLSASSVDICTREGRVLPGVVSEFLDTIHAGFKVASQGSRR